MLILASASTFESFNVESLERLVVPSAPGTDTFIPFGIDGTSVAINRYGEILSILQHVADETQQVIALDTYEPQYPYMKQHNEELNWRSKRQRTGLVAHLKPISQGEDKAFEPRLEWVNGRWPRISYELDGLRISIQFTVEQGAISQQFLIRNPSNEKKEVQYALQAVGSTVTTLHVEDDRWERNGEFDWSASKPQIIRGLNDSFTLEENKTILQQDGTTAENSTRSKAVLAIFHNAIPIRSENIVLIPVEDENMAYRGTGMKNIPLSQESLDMLCVPPHGVQELVVQYKLRPHHNKDMLSLRYHDVGTFLHNDQHGSCGFEDDIEFNTIFRRKLEHILCLCLVKNLSNSKGGPRIPFDTTFASGSTPAGDL